MSRTPRGSVLRASTVLPSVLALFVLSTVAVRAAVVSGQVTAPGMVPIDDVDLDFVETGSGMVLPTLNDNTDMLGFYAVDVPAGEYDIQFEPQPGVRYLAVELPAVMVSEPGMTLDQELPTGFLLTARVVGPDLQPIPDADLDVIDVGTGAHLFSHLDRADADGIVQPVVPAGTWDLTFSPSMPGELIPVRMDGVVIGADVDLGDVVLQRGFVVSGRVVGSDGPVVADVSVTVVDARTLESVESMRTDGMGRFSFFLPAGDYRLDAAPPSTAPYEERSFHGVEVTGDRQLPDLSLDRAAIVTGTVQDGGGGGLRGVDLDFENAFTGEAVLVGGDETDRDGNFRVILPFDVYDIEFESLMGPARLAAELDEVAVLGDTVVPTVVLDSGFSLSGRVLAPGGGPAAGLNVDAFDTVTGDRLELRGDRTDVDGTFTVRVPDGTWDVFLRPPALSGWGAAQVDAVVVTRNTDLGDVSLPSSVDPVVTAIDPPMGPEAGGTVVTIMGSGFQLGARALVGGLPLRGVVVLDGNTLEGKTRAAHRGIVDVEVENPGAAAVALGGSYEYVRRTPEPLLTVEREGPFSNDVLLTWTAVDGPGWSVHAAGSLAGLGDGVLRVTGRTWHRDEGAVLLRPGLVFYVVH